MINNYFFSLFKAKNKGFTLAELLITIALMAIFTVITVPYGIKFYRSRTIEEESRALVNVLERAKSHAVSGKEDSSWGIRFIHDENKYIFFKGDSYEDKNQEYNQNFILSPGIKTSGFIEIVFERHTGNPMITSE